jgi:hypothetical protein
MMKTTSNNMRWSTKKFAEDILFTCKNTRVPLKKALAAISKVGYSDNMVNLYYYFDNSRGAELCHWDCPVFQIKNIRCQDTSICVSEGNCYRCFKECKYHKDPPDTKNMMIMWQQASLKTNIRRVEAVKRWFKENKYLD